MSSLIPNFLKALIISPSHQCLLKKVHSKWCLPAVENPTLGRPLVIMKKELKQAIGLNLPGPCGQFPLHSISPQHFTFLLSSVEAKNSGAKLPPDYQWVPLDQVSHFLDEEEEVNQFWAQYDETLLGGHRPTSRSFDVIYFGNTPELAAKLAHLVVKGRKRGTAASCEAMRAMNQPFPHPGLLTLVTDGFGIPLCFIETVNVTKLPFRDVPPEFSQVEGEGDFSLEDWKEGHLDYFTREAMELGSTFNEDSLVMLEEFRVVKILAGPGLGD